MSLFTMLAAQRLQMGTLQSFVDLNSTFSAALSKMQVGLEMPLTPTQIATWVSDCGNANKTVAAWNAAQTDIAALNALLVKN